MRLDAMLVAEGQQVGVTVIETAVAEWRRLRREVFVLRSGLVSCWV